MVYKRPNLMMMMMLSRERHNYNYSNLQNLLPRDIARDSENYINIIGLK